MEKIAAVTIVLDTLHDDGDKSRENTEATIYPLAAEASQRNASYILNPVFRSVNPQHPSGIVRSRRVSISGEAVSLN